MFISKKELDKLLQEGGLVKGWCYDLVVARLEERGFKRKSKIDFLTGGVEASEYVGEDGHRVYVSTQRFLPATIIKTEP